MILRQVIHMARFVVVPAFAIVHLASHGAVRVHSLVFVWRFATEADVVRHDVAVALFFLQTLLGGSVEAAAFHIALLDRRDTAGAPAIALVRATRWEFGRLLREERQRGGEDEQKRFHGRLFAHDWNRHGP